MSRSWLLSWPLSWSCPARVALPLVLLSACEDPPPDPCGRSTFSCISVTVASGPAETHQLLVAVDDHGVTTPTTPRSVSEQPLRYPLRFAVQFIGEFDGFHRGQVILDVSALDRDNEVRGQIRETVAIKNYEKRAVTLRLGPPLDMYVPRPPEDLRAEKDLAAPADLSQPDLADGGAGN